MPNPRVQISPTFPRGRLCPVAGSTILTSLCCTTRPEVFALSSTESSKRFIEIPPDSVDA